MGRRNVQRRRWGWKATGTSARLFPFNTNVSEMFKPFPGATEMHKPHQQSEPRHRPRAAALPSLPAYARRVSSRRSWVE